MKHLKEMYEYREMIFSLVKKDLRGRYKGSVLGFMWTFINPLLQLLVFTLVFSIIMRANYEQYYLFLFVALVPWMFFGSSVQDGSTCIMRESNMVKKIYFPREVIPISTVTSAFINMILTFVVVFIVLLISGRGINLVALLYLPVVMIVDRAGLVGQDGETHQGIFDVSFMSAIPNLTIIAPKDTKELIESVKFAMEYNGPIAIRFPRGTAYVAEKKTASPVELGKSEIVNDGYNIAIIAVGNMFEEVEKAYNLLMKENINPTIVNARFIKPLDKDMIEYVAKRHKQIIVVEEAIKKGGYGEAVSTYVQENCLDCNVKIMAIEDCFVEQGLVDELREKIGISSKKIYEKVKELV